MKKEYHLRLQQIGSTEVYTLRTDQFLIGGMPYPDDQAIFPELSGLGFNQLVCLTDDVPDYDHSPLLILESIELEDLYGDRSPNTTASEENNIRKIVTSITLAIKNGEPTIIHCVGGTGRTGTVIAGTLRESGCTWDETYRVMMEINRLRGWDTGGWPESSWQRDLVANW